MLTTILAVIGIGFAHLMIGTVIGKWNWKVWKEGKKNLSSFILFPFTTAVDGDDIGRNWSLALITSFNSDETYVKAMAFTWPAKLVWVSITAPIAGIFVGTVKAGSFLAGMAGRIAGVAAQPIVALEKMVEKHRAKKIAAAKLVPAFSEIPMLDRKQLEEEIEKLQRQLEEKNKLRHALVSRINQ